MAINKTKSMKLISKKIAENGINDQRSNKIWWETLPMTYADWDSGKRIPKTKEDFLKIESFFRASEYLRNFDFNHFEGKKILEVGCGSGAGSCLFAKGGAEVSAIDLTSKAIEIGKRNAKAQGVKVNFYQEDAEKLHFKKDEFDYIFSWGVLHHSNDTIKAFSEASRVLKSGGKGVIMVYNKNSLRYYLNGLYWLIFRGKIFRGYNFSSVQSFYTDGYYHRHFTSRELKSKLSKVGLKCECIYITHMDTKMFQFIPNFFRRWLKRKFGWLLVAEFRKK